MEERGETARVGGLPQRVLDEVIASQSVAVVGVAKNCGKTTTLNTILQALPEAMSPGVLSVGIDGERNDLLIATRKPPVLVPEGAFVLSTQQAFETSQTPFEYVDALGYSTPMGQVYIARARRGGEVMLSGIRHAEDVALGLERLREVGARPQIVDGAYGRVMGARTDLTRAFVASTGAVVAGAIDEIVARTWSLTRRLTCQEVEEPWQRALILRSLEEGKALLGAPGIAGEALRGASALVGLSRSHDLWRGELSAIAVPGVVSNRVLEELLVVAPSRQWPRRTLLIEDGTHLHADDALLRRFERGWEVRALRRSRLIGVSYNPTSITGQGVDAEALRVALQARYGGDVSIFDGGGRGEG